MKIRLILILAFVMLFTGCGQKEEPIDINAWKENLIKPSAMTDVKKDPVSKQEEQNDLAFPGSIDDLEALDSLLSKEGPSADGTVLSDIGKLVSSQIKAWGKAEET